MPIEKHPLKWKFREDDKKLSDEFEDQIIALTSEASKFLWNFESTQRYLNSLSAIGKYFNEQNEFSFGENDSPKVKKWLFEKRNSA